MEGYNYYNPDLDKEDNETLFNFENIMTDPEEGRKAMAALRRGTVAKNTLTITEFEEYKALFMKNSRNEMGHNNYDNLCRQWNSRISSFYPVQIVTDDRTELLLTLPPIFSKPVPVNVLGSVGPELVMAFHNACSTLVDTFNRKKQHYSKLTKDAYTTAQSLVATKNKEESDAILRKFNNLKSTIEEDDEQPDFSQGEVEIL